MAKRPTSGSAGSGAGPDAARALAQYRAGRLREAAELARDVTRRAPADAGAWSVLAASLRGLGQPQRAVAAGERAVRAAPRSVDNRANLALMLADAGRLDAAETQLDRAIALADPGARTGLQHMLGQVRLAAGRPDAALSAFDAALARDPAHADALFGRGNALCARGDLEAAVAAYRQAVQARPDFAGAQANLGSTLQQLDRIEEAERACLRAVELAPHSLEAHNTLGAVRRAAGGLDDAADCFRRAAQCDPRRGEPLSNLAFAKRFQPDDPDLALLEQRRAQGLPAGAAALHLHYALGKAYADLGDRPAEAFEEFATGARLKRRSLTYDVTRDERRFAELAEAWPPAALSERATPADAPAPLFVLGMPRAGTTLVERILASHPAVAAGGEQLALGRALDALRARRGGTLPDLVANLDAGMLADLAAGYIDHRSVTGPAGTRFVTDKMPGNTAFVAVIAAAFPEARIVHVHRDPLDTCLSAFTRLFSGSSVPYSYDLEELGRYYAAQQRFLARIGDALGPDRLLELPYESLVRHAEPEVARLLAHCGLAWDEACLRFHQTPGHVRTASASQVRQPLHTGSIGAWRRYAEQLAPLRRVLQEAGTIDAEGQPRRTS